MKLQFCFVVGKIGTAMAVLFQWWSRTGALLVRPCGHKFCIATCNLIGSTRPGFSLHCCYGTVEPLYHYSNSLGRNILAFTEGWPCLRVFNSLNWTSHKSSSSPLITWHARDTLCLYKATANISSPVKSHNSIMRMESKTTYRKAKNDQHMVIKRGSTWILCTKQGASVTHSLTFTCFGETLHISTLARLTKATTSCRSFCWLCCLIITVKRKIQILYVHRLSLGWGVTYKSDYRLVCMMPWDDWELDECFLFNHMVLYFLWSSRQLNKWRLW